MNRFWRYFFIEICCFIVLFTGEMSASAASVELTGELASAGYWMQKDVKGDQIVKTPEQIRALNASIRSKHVGPVDLLSYPEEIPGYQVVSDMEHMKPAKGTLYHDGRTVSDADWQNAYADMNEKAVPQTVQVRYGITCQRANLRLLPVREEWFEEIHDLHYDDLQGTAVDPAEGIIILGENKKGDFYFVQTSNYQGWVEKMDVAVTDKSSFDRYVSPDQFVIVTEPLLRLSFKNHSYLFQMGARIPLYKAKDNQETLLLPSWNKGRLQNRRVVIPSGTKGLHKGYLPYTRNIITANAFKFLGAVYGWGGLEESVDCSSFINDVFRITGIELPRDADQQEKAIATVSFSGKYRDERRQLISSAPPCTLLFSGGHVLMKAGNLPDGNPAVIHALSSFYTFNGSKKKVYIRKVVVTDLSFQNSNRKWMMDNLTSMGEV